MYQIRDRAIKELKQINDNVFVFVKVYHINGKYCAAVNREIHERRDGYMSTMTQPFDAVVVGMDAGRYSDKKLTKYADAILPNLDGIVAAFLEINPDADRIESENKRRALATKYFWGPTANINK